MPPGGRHDRHRRRRAADKFGSAEAVKDDPAKEAARSAWLAADPWARAWKAVLRTRHRVEWWAMRHVQQRVSKLQRLLADTKDEVRA